MTWKDKKQAVIAIDPVQRYLGMAHRICELLWLKIFLHDLKLKGKGVLSSIASLG